MSGFWMDLAKATATRSPDPYLKVGALIVSADGIALASAFNDGADGVIVPWHDREARRAFVIHAEIRALAMITPAQVAGGTIFITSMPCKVCVEAVASNGLKHIRYGELPDQQRYPAGPILELVADYGLTMEQIA